MTTQEVANKLIEMCNKGQFEGAVDALYSKDIVSTEAGAPPGQSRETKGIAVVKGKSEWWATNHEVHSMKIEGPLVAGSHFTVTFKMDATFKPENKRFQMDEIAVYKVVDGKIAEEQFFYNM